MSVENKHGMYGVSLGATLLGGISAQSIALQSDVRGEPNSGEVYARILALYAQGFAPGWTTTAIAAALGLAGVSGVSIATLTGGLALYAQKYAKGGTRAGNTSHRKYAFAEGIIAPRRLSVAHRGDATLTYEAIITYDGTNAPLVITDDVTLPATLTGATERFTLGPATIGAVAINQVQQLEIDFGLDVISEGGDSDLYDTFAAIRQQQTVISLTGSDLLWLGASKIPIAGKTATNANTAIYLRKRVHGGDYVAAATAEHIQLVAAGMATIETMQFGDQSSIALRMPLYYDGTNAPIVVDTTAALPS